jgi:hypothetical protein
MTFNQMNARMGKAAYWDRRRGLRDCPRTQSLTTPAARGRAMGDGRTEGAGAALAPVDGIDRSPGTRLRRWLRVSAGERDADAAEQMQELEREVALLREENARLKVSREHAHDRPVNERVRAALPTLRDDRDPDGDHPWEVLTECMLLRDELTDACRELERGARELRGRLETLLPDAESTGGPEGAGADVRPRAGFESVV